MKTYLKPVAVGLLAAFLGYGIIVAVGKAHYYFRVVKATEQILINSKVPF